MVLLQQLLHILLLYLAVAAVTAAAAAPNWKTPGTHLGSRRLLSRRELQGMGAPSLYGTPGTFPAQVPQFGSRLNATTVQQVLDLHNIARAQHGTPPLVWDITAAAWAQRFADNCVWGHDVTDPYVSNIAVDYPDWPSAFHTWYNDELPLYDWSNPGYSDATGHMTALLWKSSTKLGCATQYCVNIQADGSLWNGTYYNCYYYPPGNVDSPAYFQANVLPLLPNYTMSSNGTVTYTGQQ